VAGSTFWFQEAAPVSVRFRAAEAESGWAAALACLAEAHLLAPEADFREPAVGFLALVVDSPLPVDDFIAAVAGSPWKAADSHEPEVDSLARVAALADSVEVHSLAPVAGSREPEVELLVPAADFRARVAALADSAVVHSHAPVADFRELAERQGSPGLAHSRGPAVDCRVPLVSQAVLHSAWSAARPAAFLLRVAAADWLAVLRLYLPAALEQASRSSQCETRSASVSTARRELLAPKAPSSSQLVCSQAFRGDAPTVSQEH
jgi:hypothetical protein